MKEFNIWYFYLIFSPSTNIKYVGKTQDLRQRWSNHKSDFKTNRNRTSCCNLFKNDDIQMVELRKVFCCYYTAKRIEKEIIGLIDCCNKNNPDPTQDETIKHKQLYNNNKHYINNPYCEICCVCVNSKEWTIHCESSQHLENEDWLNNINV